MKVLFVHNQYQLHGGEDAVVANELELTRKNGISASLFSISNESIQTPLDRIKTALTVSYSKSSKNRLAHELEIQKPDLVHVHNFFPLLTPSIYDACIEAKIPVVQSLHNFRTVCANGLFLRDGKACELCLHGNPYQSVLYGCYRNSALATLPVARMISRHRSEHTWQNKVNRFIALSVFAKKKFIEAGFPPDRISIKPNFSNDPFLNAPRPEKKKQGYALYMGRLSSEKGVLNLLRAWKELDFPLHIAGSGPLLEQIQNEKSEQVRVLGFLSNENWRDELLNASFLILPSECYEGFPVILAEAFSFGLPILASNMGSLKALVTEGETGIHFEAGNPSDLAAKAKNLFLNPELLRKMSEESRKTYLEKYTPEVNFKLLQQIYKKALQA